MVVAQTLALVGSIEPSLTAEIAGEIG